MKTYRIEITHDGMTFSSEKDVEGDFIEVREGYLSIFKHGGSLPDILLASFARSHWLNVRVLKEDA